MAEKLVIVRRALFRFDASPEIGSGHASRSMALADAMVAAGWDVTLAVRATTLECGIRFSDAAKKIVIIDESKLAEPAAAFGELDRPVDLAVIDSYAYGFEYEAGCRAWTSRVAVFDDGAIRPHDCDAIIDAACANERTYRARVPRGCIILAGSPFAIVRSQFLDLRALALARRDGRRVCNILVSMGATDPTNLTPGVLRCLDAVSEDVKIVVAISSSAPFLEEVERCAARNCVVAKDVEDMAHLMTQSDIAVGTGGATAFERAVLGLPSVIVLAAENQGGIRRMMTEGRAALDGGTADDMGEVFPSSFNRLLQDARLRVDMALSAAALIDGQGAARVAAALGELQ